jgi:Spy/CpxP family protein refolding chaperone
MKSKKWITMAAALTLVSTLAFAGPHEGKGGRHGRHGGGQFGAKFAEKLNLSEGQKQQIKDAQKQFREENKAFFEQARDTRRQMREAKEAGDTAKLTQLQATAKSQGQRMKQLRDAQEQRITSFLTPDQKAQWDALKAERQARRGQRQPRGERF